MENRTEPNKTLLVLIAVLIVVFAALLPSLTYAGQNMISAGAERGSPCNITTATTTVVIADLNEGSDPMEATVSQLVNGSNDPVLAAHYRDLYRAPASSPTVTFVNTPDPLVDAIAKALYGSVETDSQRVCLT